MAEEKKPGLLKTLLAIAVMIGVGVGLTWVASRYWDHPENPLKKQGLASDWGITDNDVGAIMFVCNDSSHGDQEVVIDSCPDCKARKRFFTHPKKAMTFFCLDCDEKLDPEKIVCSDCGNAPRKAGKVRLKR